MSGQQFADGIASTRLSALRSRHCARQSPPTRASETAAMTTTLTQVDSRRKTRDAGARIRADIVFPGWLGCWKSGCRMAGAPSAAARVCL